MKKTVSVLFLCLILLIGTSFSSSGQIRIAVSKTSEHYEKWLRTADPDLETVNMYGMKIDSAVMMLCTVSGLLLTGGEDVNPAWYGKSDELSKCEEIDNYRDSLELALIKRAVLVGMPVFGICRGEQILNIALGGTLFTDIPTDMGVAVLHRCPEGSKECLHLVTIDAQSILYRMTSVSMGDVNSYHHQAVDEVAPGMKITAFSDNGIAESIEREDPQGKSFLMGVQWHPERLSQNPDLALPLASSFLEYVKEYRKLKRSCCGAH